jgi:signal transduction histidine kinase
MLVNALVSVYVSHKLKDIDHQILVKRVGSSIAFLLLGTIFINGLVRINLIVYLPWIFLYPLPVMLFFGKRLGLWWAIIFSIASAWIIIAADISFLSSSDVKMFKIHAVTVLFSLMLIALISEKIRLRVQNDLVAAQKKYKEAENQQREANKELKREIGRRTQSETALRQSESRYRALFEESPISLWEEDYSEIKKTLDSLPSERRRDLGSFFENSPDTLEKCLRMIKVVAVNKATLKLFGAENQKVLLDNVENIIPSSYKDFYKERLISLYYKGSHSAPSVGQTPTLAGKQLHLMVRCSIPTGYEDSWSKIFVSVYDMTERFNIEQEKKRVEFQLQEAQKLQATATLSGGIAHEFNNALAVIHGNLELIELDLKDHPDKIRSLIPVKSSVKRMARLTSQLLAYAQGGKYEPQMFSINDLLEEMIENKEALLIHPSMEIKTEFSADFPTVIGDKIQIRMVIEAVLSNALESIKEDGKVQIKTLNDSIGQDRTEPHPLLSAGEYTVISTEDNGFGMDEDTRNRIFEPFFTTKIRGRGLGMSAAYGIIRNHGGIIYVESKPRVGTRIKIYLPSIVEKSD